MGCISLTMAYKVRTWMSHYVPPFYVDVFTNIQVSILRSTQWSNNAMCIDLNTWRHLVVDGNIQCTYFIALVQLPLMMSQLQRSNTIYVCPMLKHIYPRNSCMWYINTQSHVCMFITTGPCLPLIYHCGEMIWNAITYMCFFTTILHV